MFETNSRYYKLETAQLTVVDSDGAPRLIAYKRRRFVPPAEGMTTLVEHALKQGDRLDNISALYQGDPTQFWLICDANNVLHPHELTETVGRAIKIALPGV